MYLDNHKSNLCKLPVDAAVLSMHIGSYEQVKERIFLGIQRRREGEDILKRDCLNLELCMKIHLHADERKAQCAYIRVNRALQRTLGVSQERLWEDAMANTLAHLQILPMRQVLSDLAGVVEPDTAGGQIPAGEGTHPDLWIVNAGDHLDGASALFFPSVMERFCRQTGETGCYLLPSSRFELILVPESQARGTLTPDLLAGLVSQVNDSCVQEEHRLEACVYRYNLGEGALTIAASL